MGTQQVLFDDPVTYDAPDPVLPAGMRATAGIRYAKMRGWAAYYDENVAVAQWPAPKLFSHRQYHNRRWYYTPLFPDFFGGTHYTILRCNVAAGDGFGEALKAFAIEDLRRAMWFFPPGKVWCSFDLQIAKFSYVTLGSEVRAVVRSH